MSIESKQRTSLRSEIFLSAGVLKDAEAHVSLPDALGLQPRASSARRAGMSPRPGRSP